MFKKLTAVAGVVQLTLVLPGTTSTATGHSDHGDLALTSIFDEEQFVDNAPAGESVGDMFVFSADLFKKGKSRQVGRAGVSCTLTSSTAGDALCSGSVSLRKGKISILGLQTGEESENDELEFPIVGGTGRYEGASGTLTVIEVSDTEETLIFDFD